LTCGYPYGPQIQLLYDQSGANPLAVTYTEDAGNFRSDDGDDRLSQAGYDRTIQPATTAQVTITAMGAAKFSKPIYRPKHAIAARLQLLTNQQVSDTLGMFERQRLELKLITLLDQRLVTREPAPRIRARFGTLTDAPVTAGMEAFWGLYRIWVLQYSEPYQINHDENYLDFEAVEVGAPIAP
jgi:hypothetical protein